MAIVLSAAILGAASLLQPTLPKQTLDDGWTFTLTVDDKGHPVDSAPAIVDLPHDWSVLNDFTGSASVGNDGGYLPAGAGIYAKSVSVAPGDLNGRKVILSIDGAYMNPAVTVNGMPAASHAYGYSSLLVDITPYLKEGDNTLEIAVDNSAQKNCRWYSGSGIYRHVSLLNMPEVNVAPWSVFVTTPTVNADKATVDIEFAINGGDAPVTAFILSPEGKEVAWTEKEGVEGSNAISLTVDNPSLWSPGNPALYTLLLTAGAHTVEQTFGIRSLSFSAQEGMKLNGEPITLNGACVHHDNGILGARSYDAAEARKVALLKEAGFNAVRTSHNPPSPAFLDECDLQGLLVIDESFDGWREAKLPSDYHLNFDSDWASDIEAMVLRDRNHPSIIAWSIGNEVIERKKIEVVTTAARLVEKCRSLDPTRPVTSALAAWDSDWEIYDPLAAVHDIVGYNYMIHKSEEDHERVPERILWQTESYPRDAFGNWTKVNDHPYIIGDFVWTGIDYLGESGIGRSYYTGQTEGEHYERDQFPWHASYCGDIDLTGLRKPVSHYREMLHNPDSQSVYMAVREPSGHRGEIRETLWGTWPTLESWNWDGHEGKPITVEVVSRVPAVALFLNGKKIGTAPTTRKEKFLATFEVPYAPGRLVAKALDTDGKPTGEEYVLETAGVPMALRLSADRSRIAANNQDLAFITVEAIDRKGRVVPNAAPNVTFTLSGEGTIIATGSGDGTDTEGYHRPNRRLWHGRGLAVVKSSHNGGKLRLTASAPGLNTAEIEITTE